MFRVLYKPVFSLQLKRRFFNIQLAMSLKYEISYTLENEI